MYYVHLLPKRFRRGLKSTKKKNEKKKKKKKTKLQHLHFTKKNINRKKEMTQKTKLNKTLVLTVTIEFEL